MNNVDPTNTACHHTSTLNLKVFGNIFYFILLEEATEDLGIEDKMIAMETGTITMVTETDTMATKDKIIILKEGVIIKADMIIMIAIVTKDDMIADINHTEILHCNY